MVRLTLRNLGKDNRPTYLNGSERMTMIILVIAASILCVIAIFIVIKKTFFMVKIKVEEKFQGNLKR